LIGGVAVGGYFLTKVLSNKLGVGSGTTVAGDLSSLLSPAAPVTAAPTPDQLAAYPTGYPTINTQVPNLQPPLDFLTSTPYQAPFISPLANPYQLAAGNIYPGSPNLNKLYPYTQTPIGAFLNQPNGYPQPLGFGGRVDNGPLFGFAAKKQGGWEHGHHVEHEHDTNKNQKYRGSDHNHDQTKGDYYLTDTDDEELEVEEPYLHEIYGVDHTNADMADFDTLAYAEEDDKLDPEEEDVHVHMKETDINEQDHGYAGHGDRHKHDRHDDSENRHRYENRPKSHHYDMHGMGNDFKSRLVRDHKGKMMGLSHQSYY
jgi:hypothetical protein